MNKLNMVKNLKNHYIDEIRKCISDLKTKGRRRKQIPNILSASRIVAPLVVIPCFYLSSLPVALIVTGVFALTDALDGKLAKKLNATSEFGEELDPFADKIFASGLIIPIIAKNPIILTNLLLEGVISGINLKSKLKGNTPKSNILGKIKTWSLSLLLIANYCSLFFNLSNIISSSLLVVTSILQVATSIKYYKDDKLKDISKKIVQENKNTTVINNQREKEHKAVKEKVIEALKMQKNILENRNKQLGDKCNKTLHK